MNELSNREIICEELMKAAAEDPTVVALCSDSRGSAAMKPFAQAFPKQFFEMGIAEQNLVTAAAGMACCGLKPFVFSPACFLSSRALEQVKVDVAYSCKNVKLIGISGGVSYGALGMTHHSTQDIAAVASIPGMRVFLPCDRFETASLMRGLINDEHPAYIRVSRQASQDVYEEGFSLPEIGKAVEVCPGTDITLIGCGETVIIARQAAELLAQEGISARVLDMYSLKPFDEEAVKRAAETGRIITVEEHHRVGGLGSMVAQTVSACRPCPVRSLTLPDEPVIAGKASEVFAYYGLTAQNLCRMASEMVEA